MVSIEKSGYCYPNRAGRIFLQSLEEVMGRNGVSAILNLAGLQHWIDNYPPKNLRPGVDFAEFSAINAALEEMYGPQGGHGLARRAGWATFENLLRSYGPLPDLGSLVLKVLPLQTKMRAGLVGLAGVFSRISDQETEVQEQEQAFSYVLHRCPVCWGRRAQEPCCYAVVGLLEQCLRWISGGRTFSVQETHCIALGEEACVFHIDKAAIE